MKSFGNDFLPHHFDLGSLKRTKTNNTGLQGFVVEKLWVVFGVTFDVESEFGIRISLSH